MGADISCPVGFQPNPLFAASCVVQCDELRGFEARNVDNQPHCVYRDRPEVKVLLKSVMGLKLPENQPKPTLEQLQTLYPGGRAYSDYKEIKDDYDKKFPAVLAQVEKDQQIKDAFNQLQTAENVRDQSPQGYQDARNRYYTLTKGETWLTEEGQRVANAEVLPKVTQYSQIRNDLKARLGQQQQTIDVVNSVKDKVLSMRDDFAYTTNTFAKQIAELKNQINIEKKKTEEEKIQVASWADMLLNIFITILALALLFVIARKVIYKPSPTTPSSVYTSMRR